MLNITPPNRPPSNVVPTGHSAETTPSEGSDLEKTEKSTLGSKIITGMKEGFSKLGFHFKKKATANQQTKEPDPIVKYSSKMHRIHQHFQSKEITSHQDKLAPAILSGRKLLEEIKTMKEEIHLLETHYSTLKNFAEIKEAAPRIINLKFDLRKKLDELSTLQSSIKNQVEGFSEPKGTLRARDPNQTGMKLCEELNKEAMSLLSQIEAFNKK